MAATQIHHSDELLDASAAIKKLVDVGREMFATVLPKENFDAPFWSVKSLHDRSHQSTASRLYFTRYGSNSVLAALPLLYAEVIKSWLILEWTSVSQMKQKLYAVKVLWDAVFIRLNNKEEAFRWEHLCEEDLHQAEILMQGRLSQKSTYVAAGYLSELADFLFQWRICRLLYWSRQTPCPEDSGRYTLAGQEARRALLPSGRALLGLADIYHIHAKEPCDRLLICAIAILVVTGFRVDELLKMPEDCEVEEVYCGKARYGLRIYKEKTRGGEKMCWVKWLTPIQAELARRAIAEVRAITAAARKQAKILEANPNTVPIPGFSWADRMSPDDVAKAFGMGRRAVRKISRENLPRHQDERGRTYYRTSDVEVYLRSQRVENLWTLDLKNGTYQMLSQTLFIVPKNFFHAIRGTNPLLIQDVGQGHISEFLAGDKAAGMKSAFERFGIQEEDGSFCKMHSHQLRHWLNDLADRGGLPTDLQTRWMGREYSRDTGAYQHMTMDQRIKWLKDGIRSGEITGEIADVYFQLPEGERDDFLGGQVVAVHFTSIGVCLHDFSMTPCSFHLNCVRGCSEFCRTKGNQKERENLRKLQQRTEQALEMAQKAVADRNGELAEHWIQHNQEMLKGIKAALAVDDDSKTTEGTVVYPFEGRESRFEPITDWEGED